MSGQKFDLDAFKKAGLIPDFVPEGFNTNDFMEILYPDNVKVNLGNLLTRGQGKPVPKVTFKVEDDSALYTLLCIDPDAPTRNYAFLGPVRHWAVVNIPGSAGNSSAGKDISRYLGPGPPPFTGEHRYVFLLYKQLSADAKFELPFRPMRWDYKTFIQENQLQLVAADFYVAKF